MPKIFEWAKSHPVETGGIVFVGGVVVLYFLGFFSGGSNSSSGSDPNAAAYYAAESAQGQAGDELQAIQIQSQAQTAQDLINDNASQAINTTWAGADVQTAQINATAQQAIAPYAVENNLVSTLGAVASQPPNVVTSTSSNNGFFGIGASTQTNTSVVPNASAVDATGLLNELTTDGFHAIS